MPDDECLACGGLGFVADPSACDDVEHCDPTMDCPNCGPEVRPEPEPDDAA